MHKGIRKTVATLLLGVFTLTSMPVGPEAFAAESVPAEITLTDHGYGSRGNVTYPSANGLGSCTIHQLKASQNGAEGPVFCADHTKSLMKRFVGQKWIEPKPVRAKWARVYMDAYYTYERDSKQIDASFPQLSVLQKQAKAKELGKTYWSPWQREYNCGWIQAVTWLSLKGVLSDDMKAEDVFQKAAKERDVVLKAYGYDTGRDSYTSLQAVRDIAYRWSQGSYPRQNYYEYRYGGKDPAGELAPSGVQPLIMPVLEEPDGEAAPFWLTLEKTDPDGKALSGARFGVFCENGVQIGSFTTKGTGAAYGPFSFPMGQRKGTFYVEELEPAPGYTLGSLAGKRFSVTVDASVHKKEHPAKVDGSPFVNEPADRNSKPEGVIQKIDARTGEGIGPAVFQITGKAEDGSRIDTRRTSDERGSLKLQWTNPDQAGYLPPGFYQVREAVPPEGYTLSDESYPLHLWIKEGMAGHSGPVVFQNTKEKKLIIQKTDPDGKPLSGAVFDIYRNDLLLCTEKTDAEGRIVLDGRNGKGIQDGCYEVVETKAPNGYLKETVSVKHVLFSKEDRDLFEYVLTFTNDAYPEIVIEKTEQGTGKPLGGAVFEVMIDGTLLPGRVQTGEDGLIVLNRETYGAFLDETKNAWTVSVREVHPPAGYLLDQANWQIAELKKGMKLSSFMFTDTPYPEIVVKKTDRETGKPLKGARFQILLDGTSFLQEAETDENGEIRISYEKYGRFIPSKQTKGVTVRVTELQAPDGYNLDPQKEDGGRTQTQRIQPGQKLSVFDFQDTAYRDLQIVKRDSVHGKPLSGAVFCLHSLKGNLQAEHDRRVTTGKDGTAVFSKVPNGTYEVREEKVPEGYEELPAKQIVTVTSESAPVISLYFENTPKPSLRILKTDAETGEGLGGAVFEIRSCDGTVADRVTTDREGVAYTGALSAGTYQVKETKAPSGYRASSESRSVCVKAGQTKTLTVTNRKAATLVARKIDSKTGKPLPGAVFKLEHAERHDLVGTMESDQNGEAVFTGLNEGIYIITETQPPAGYELSEPSSQTIQIFYGKNNYVDFKNVEQGSLLITLQDRKTGTLLKGGEFHLIREQDQLEIYHGYTDHAGSIVIGNLSPGWYRVEQKQAPDGYTVTERVKKAEVLSGRQQTVHFYNTTTGIVTEAVDGRHPEKLLEGARIQLIRNHDHIVMGEKVTGKDGLAVFGKLEPGMYTVKELSAPKGYTMDTKEQIVELKADTTAHATFTHTPLTGITVSVQDAVSGKPVPGASVEVRSVDGAFRETFATDQSGLCKTGMLKPGYYQVKVVNVPEGYSFFSSCTLNGAAAEKPETTVKVDAGVQITYGFYPARLSSLTVYAKDEEGGLLDGMEVLLTEQNGKRIGTFRTEPGGSVTVNSLPPGWYQVVELKAPEGFLPQKLPISVEVKNGAQAEVSVVHTLQGSLTVRVEDAKTHLPVFGVVTELWKADGTFRKRSISDHSGLLLFASLSDGDYVLKTVTVPDGYSCAKPVEPVRIENGGTVTRTLLLSKAGSVTVKSIDTKGMGISGMKVKISRPDGSCIGEYGTDGNGIVVIPNLFPGFYTAEETVVPKGYRAIGREKHFEVTHGAETVLEFSHEKEEGLQIVTVTGDDPKQRVSGAVYEIRTLSGTRLGRYTGDEDGLVFADIPSGWVEVVPISLKKGYRFVNPEPVKTEVKTDRVNRIEIPVYREGHVDVKVVDGITGNGIYGVRLQLKGENGTIHEYVTDQEGRITTTETAGEETLKLEMIAVPDGYILDRQVKTIQKKDGKTTEIVWVLYREGGQIQVKAVSADYNESVDRKPGSAVRGAKFEIVDADTYQVMCTVTTDSSGIGASVPLPKGRYTVRQIGSAPYYAMSPKKKEVRLKVNNDIVQVRFKNPSVHLKTEVGLRSNYGIRAGSVMRVDLYKIQNASDVRLDHFFVHLKVPTDAARLSTFYTGRFSHDVTYRIQYRTNRHDYRVLAKNLSAKASYQYGVSSRALGLQAGEYVTDLRMEFETVPAGFRLVTRASVTEYILQSVTNGYKVLNRLEAGGAYGNRSVPILAPAVTDGHWAVANGLWTTLVANPQIVPGRLPQMGY